jgi:hypothetical protein
MTPKKRGKPFKIGNQCGKGRPPGSRNKATLVYGAMIEAEGAAIIRTMLRLAKRGDRNCLKMVMERLVARRTENPITLDLPTIRTSQDLQQAYQKVVGAAAHGDITSEQAERMTSVLEVGHKLVENEELARRMDQLEERLQKIEEDPHDRNAA